MSEYDETNKGVMFAPYSDQKLAGQGKVNIDGDEVRIAITRQPLKKDGDPVLVVWKQMGILYPNDQKGNEKAPVYSGPIDERADLRWAAWRGEKNGHKYLQIKVSPKENPDSEPDPKNPTGRTTDGILDDDVPF